MKNNLTPFQKTILLTAFLILIFGKAPLHAQIIISEFSAANQGDFISSTGDDNDDWVELHNQGASAEDIGGYYLSDKLGNPTKWEIPSGTMIPPNGYLRIWCSGENGMIGGELHTKFRISQTKNSEDIVLANPSGTVIDFNEINTPNQIHHSYGKDANGNWGVSINPTPGYANGTIYEKYEETPVLSPDAGFYTGQVTVNIAVPPNSTVYYTTDGSRPNNNSTTYTNDIVLTNT
ncbi:MAG TPA: hypothetical protein ENJ53_03645, partial [Phaeodactylibacter sp.]|nr:hypothetical protein [Phaeodactylibacter sp.]